ncbi:MAG TPA: hypothetical protein VFA82_03040 [Gaiellaceae bacterium]|nr:hypothetical protein [Gaiellaceae bacterium]
MYHHMDAADWFWMIPAMLLWIAVLGGVVYLAVRLANEHSHR